jgi:hypothetical protein
MVLRQSRSVISPTVSLGNDTNTDNALSSQPNSGVKSVLFIQHPIKKLILCHIYFPNH